MQQEELAFLLDLKALMDHAIFHQQNGTKLDMRLAVNHAHQAVELTLRKKAELLGKNPYDFPSVKRELKKSRIKIPYERQIDELNKARTLTQHYGTTPNENDARRLIFMARDFLIDFWKDAFDVEYDDVSMVDMISNEGIRKLLLEAQGLAEDQNYQESTVKSVQAIHEVKWWIRRKFRVMPAMTPMGGDVLQQGLDLVLEIALSSPFINRLRKLRETTGIIFLPIPGGKPVMQQLGKHEIVRESALSALELATDYTLWAEQVYS